MFLARIRCDSARPSAARCGRGMPRGQVGCIDHRSGVGVSPKPVEVRHAAASGTLLRSGIVIGLPAAAAPAGRPGLQLRSAVSSFFRARGRQDVLNNRGGTWGAVRLSACGVSGSCVCWISSGNSPARRACASPAMAAGADQRTHSRHCSIPRPPAKLWLSPNGRLNPERFNSTPSRRLPATMTRPTRRACCCFRTSGFHPAAAEPAGPAPKAARTPLRCTPTEH